MPRGYVQCPLCITNNKGQVFAVGSDFPGGHWVVHPYVENKWIRCPLCRGGRQVRKELAAAFTLIDLDEAEVLTYDGLVKLRKTFNRRSFKKQKSAYKRKEETQCR